MAEIILTEATFENEVINSDIPVLVDFWAEWCGPCKMLAPIIEEIANEYEGKAKICKVNVDKESSLAAKYGIMSIPTLILFKNGEIADKTVGLRSKEQIKELLK